MNKEPNRFEIWIYYDSLCARPDWFKEADCNTIEEVVLSLRKFAMYFKDSFEELDKYFEVKAFHNKHEIQHYFSSVSSILKKYDNEWSENFNECMKKCKTCVMYNETEKIEDTDNEWANSYICREGKPWFCKNDCPFYILEDPRTFLFDGNDSFDYIPMIKEEMNKIDCKEKIDG